jgi:hypothetical protein
MRAFSADKDEVPRDINIEDGAAPRRVVKLKTSTSEAESRGGKRARENGDAEEGEAPKRGVRGRGAATFQSSVVVAVDDGPRREPPDADPSRVLKVIATCPCPAAPVD